MGLSDIDTGGAWVPDTCALPSAQRPLRVAEFDALFATAVRGIERVTPARLRLDFQADPQVAGRVAELMAAETGCCSFFTFILTATGGGLVLEVTVPEPHIGVLDALADRVAAAAGIAA
jgi:hypothetical protein